MSSHTAETAWLQNLAGFGGGRAAQAAAQADSIDGAGQARAVFSRSTLRRSPFCEFSPQQESCSPCPRWHLPESTFLPTKQKCALNKNTSTYSLYDIVNTYEDTNDEWTNERSFFLWLQIIHTNFYLRSNLELVKSKKNSTKPELHIAIYGIVWIYLFLKRKKSYEARME